MGDLKAKKKEEKKVGGTKVRKRAKIGADRVPGRGEGWCETAEGSERVDGRAAPDEDETQTQNRCKEMQRDANDVDCSGRQRTSRVE